MPRPKSKSHNGKPARGITHHASRITVHPLYPTCDGEQWSNESRTDPQKKIKRAFLEAYFKINVAYSRLVASRKQRRSQLPASLERSLLQQIERALIHRESLDDRYASRGIVATPVYHDGFTTDVRFTDVHTRKTGVPLATSSSSLRISIPLPAALRAKLCKS